MTTLEKKVLAARSIPGCNAVVNWVGEDDKRFSELVSLALSNDTLISQRAAWPFSYAAIAHPHLVKKHAGKLIRHLDKPGLHNAITRNITRVFAAVPTAKQHHGRLINACFRFIADPSEKAAIKAFSLAILEQLSANYPEIRQELISVIEDRWDHESPAFRARAKHIHRPVR